MFTKLKHLPLLLTTRRSRLKKLPKDERDLVTEDLGWFGYTPKHKRHIIKTLSIKNQSSLNTCQWNATAVQKEIDEKKVLSVRSFVIAGLRLGLVGKLGLSNMRSGQIVLQKWGILSEKTCPDTYKKNWNKYTDFDILAHADEAAKHKIKSYWKVTSLNDVYKLLDEGRTLTFGMPWYTGFNQGGGFKFPWIIEKIIGWLVGGHAMLAVGYDSEYQSKKVIICQNSYGSNWGDKGKLYITEEHFVKYALKKYGCFVNLDIPKNQAVFLKQFQGKIVKGDKNNGVFLIEKDKKRGYRSWDAFYTHNPMSMNDLKKLIIVVPQGNIDEIEEGELLTVENSEYYAVLKNLQRPFLINKG